MKRDTILDLVLIITIIILFALFLASCGGKGGGGNGVGGSPSPEAVAVTDISGNWKFSNSGSVKCEYSDGTSDSSNPSGTGSFHINQNNNNINWTVSVNGSDYPRSGTINGNNIQVAGDFAVPLVSGVSFSQNIYSASGTLSADTLTFQLSGKGTAVASYQGLTITCSGTDTLTATRLPSAPTGLKVITGIGQVTLSWNNVDGATSYNIYYGKSPGVTKANGTKIAAVSSPQTITGLTSGTTYYLVVTAVGSTGESAESGEVSATITAQTVSLVSIAVTPNNPSIAIGAMQQFIATGTYSDGTTQNITGSVTWSSSNTSIATISSSGLATGIAAGTTTITATYGTITGTTMLTVTSTSGNNALVSIAVTPNNPSIAIGAMQQFIATGTYSDSTTQNITGSVTWSSSNISIATISSSGLATGIAAGTTTITATYGTITGTTMLTVTSTSGSGNYALHFDGGDKVVVTNSASLNPLQITVETWVNLDRIVSGGNQFLVSKGNDGTQGSYYMSQNGNNFYFYLGANGVDQVYAIASLPGLAINHWYHVAGTYDGVNIKIYVDGVLKGTTPANIVIGNTGLLTFGFQDRPSWPYYLQGTLDEVRIWNVARTASDIQATMNQTLTGSETGLAAYWKLNEGSGQLIGDSTANGNNGQLGSTSGIDIDDPTWVLGN